MIDVGVLGVRGVAGDVDDDAVGVRLDDVERGDDAAGLADGGGEVTDHAGGGGRLDPDGDRSTRDSAKASHLQIGLPRKDSNLQPAG